MTVCGGPDYALRAASAGEPNVGVRLLHRLDPWIDSPIVVVLALIPEGAWRRPALDDQVMGLLEALKVLSGVDAAMQALDGRTTHEARDDAAAGEAIEHGDLLRHAHRVVDGDDVAKDSDLGLLRHFT